MLEVIIGLVFTYLLLSLLVTTLNELMASWRGWRGYFLEEGLKKILEFKEDKTVFASFKDNAMYQQLENDGKVVGRLSKAPSYLSSESFVNILFKALRGTVTAKDLISQLPPQSKIRSALDDLKDETKGSLTIFRMQATNLRDELKIVLNNKEDREANVEAFINSLPTGSKLQDVVWSFWRESNSKVEIFQVKVDMWYTELIAVLDGKPNIRNILNQIPESSRLRKVLDQLWEDSNEDLDTFKSSVQGWYNELMERASGWYKKHIQLVTFLFGLAIAVGLNADTFSIYERLSTNSSARQDVVRLATDFVNKSEQTITEPSMRAPNAQEITQKIDKLLKEDIDEARNPLGLGWRTHREDFAFLDQSVWDWLQRIAGWFVTALAISLGAPFWFDLLRKFVRVSGSGNLPAGSNSTKVVINTESSRIQTQTQES
ncbi:MAG: hypothetical protein ACI9XO_003908 [Paraglaciecola sp.]|jgi:hypothetical protein